MGFMAHINRRGRRQNMVLSEKMLVGWGESERSKSERRESRQREGEKEDREGEREKRDVKRGRGNEQTNLILKGLQIRRSCLSYIRPFPTTHLLYSQYSC
ncbi:hypothetical protein BsWGS_11858 [Bradybaena similaris]